MCSVVIWQVFTFAAQRVYSLWAIFPFRLVWLTRTRMTPLGMGRVMTPPVTALHPIPGANRVTCYVITRDWTPTCHVSGDHRKRFRETELTQGSKVGLSTSLYWSRWWFTRKYDRPSREYLPRLSTLCLIFINLVPRVSHLTAAVRWETLGSRLEFHLICNSKRTSWSKIIGF